MRSRRRLLRRIVTVSGYCAKSATVVSQMPDEINDAGGCVANG
jgi:hypothetical protein